VSILDQPTRQISASTRDRLEQEARALEERRIELIAEQSQAETGGDLVDQASVAAQQIEIENVDRRLAHIRELLTSATVAKGGKSDSVAIGTVVTLKFDDGSTEAYQVGEIEEQIGDIVALTPTSPLGQALIGHRKGDRVTYDAPAGELTVEIMKVAAA
jgi:transcription elongation factor GreA